MEISKNLLRVYQEYNNRNQIDKDKGNNKKVKSNEEQKKSEKITSLEISEVAKIASENRKASMVNLSNANKAFELFKSL